MIAEFGSIVTVTLNPTIDRIIEVPGFTIGGHQQGRLHLREPAGKAINVSRALSELGLRNSAIGWVGMNAFDLFHEAMQAVDNVQERHRPGKPPHRPQDAPGRDVGVEGFHNGLILMSGEYSTFTLNSAVEFPGIRQKSGRNGRRGRKWGSHSGRTTFAP